MKHAPFFGRFLESEKALGESDAGRMTGGTIIVTKKYPSDDDEIATKKYPSDDDEG